MRIKASAIDNLFTAHGVNELSLYSAQIVLDLLSDLDSEKAFEKSHPKVAELITEAKKEGFLKETLLPEYIYKDEAIRDEWSKDFRGDDTAILNAFKSY